MQVLCVLTCHGKQWVMGIPMNQSQPARLEIVEMTEPILGDFLQVCLCPLCLDRATLTAILRRSPRRLFLPGLRHGIWATSPTFTSTTGTVRPDTIRQRISPSSSKSSTR